MQAKVDDLERDRHAQFGTLAEQLRQAHQSGEALRATTESLASALRSGSTRGVWGETQLRRVVEAAGLTRYIDFDTQTSITSDAGAGRPDMVIRLPGDKAIAVDAKVPLDAYLEASAIPLTALGAEGARRKALLEKHVKAVRAHIDALARKTYWAGLSSSPEFVVCFVPERVAAGRRTRGRPVTAGLRVRQARGARLAGEPVGGAQDGRLHVDAAGRLARGPGSVRARQRAVRATRQARRPRRRPAARDRAHGRQLQPLRRVARVPRAGHRAPVPRHRPDQAGRAGGPRRSWRSHRDGSPRPNCWTARSTSTTEPKSGRMPRARHPASPWSPRTSATCANASHRATD